MVIYVKVIGLTSHLSTAYASRTSTVTFGCFSSLSVAGTPKLRCVPLLEERDQKGKQSVSQAATNPPVIACLKLVLNVGLRFSL